ncbi:hypothetical protein PInf_012585 [Phytophthora infestans]|nr:hypothetical protein PInf_012585 [Phytophthora infestans]
MAATKLSKKQRGKLKATKAKKESAKSHVKFDDNGDQVVPKKRARVIKKNAEEVKEGGGKSDRSPEMIQQAKYYLEQWQKRNEPKADDELPWKELRASVSWIQRKISSTLAFLQKKMKKPPLRERKDAQY